MQSMYEFVLSQLQATKGNWPTVARESGVSFRTVEKIARRQIKDPGVSHIQKLADYFRACEKRTHRATELPA